MQILDRIGIPTSEYACGACIEMISHPASQGVSEVLNTLQDLTVPVGLSIFPPEVDSQGCGENQADRQTGE
jgi:hypothetical protein